MNQSYKKRIHVHNTLIYFLSIKYNLLKLQIKINYFYLFPKQN